MTKKRIALFFLLLTISFPLVADTSVPETNAMAPVQIFMPKTAYVGDTAELRFIFHTSANILNEEETHRDLAVDIPAFSAQSENCTILSATLDRFGSEYTLSLTLVGWKVGQIDFAPFAMGDYLIDLEPVQINSIVEKTGAQGFRPHSPPLVVPGTTVVLAVLAVVFLLIFAAGIFALFHIPAITEFFASSRQERLIKRNIRIALRKLHQLTEKNLSDAHFCAAVQHILRAYLSKRFAYDFSAVDSSAVQNLFSELCGGNLTEAQDSFVQRLLYVFNRTDYIRYAHVAMESGEKEKLLHTAMDTVQQSGGDYADF